MSTRLSTKKRRVLQLLSSSLDRHLGPMIQRGVVLAVSGGPDSRALLEAVAQWPQRNLGKIIVATLDHGMRPEAKAEGQHVALRAQRLGFLVEQEQLISTALLGEHDLRDFRYRALKKIARLHGCQVICTAHHQDDDAEGYFMALMGVGGGELGAAMNEREKLDDLFLIRPFLNLVKKDLLLALTLHHQTDFAIDSLDEKGKGQRAYVRSIVFPRLRSLTPGLKSRLASFGRAERRKQALIEGAGSKLIEWDPKDGARLCLRSSPEPLLLRSAMSQILKKLCLGEDLRASQKTLDQMIESIKERAGLDQRLNGFNLKDLSAKQYYFPGVVAIVSAKDILVRRVLSYPR